MRITRIELRQFRNYESADVEPCAGISVLVGDNAQGKTNLLEAVYLSCVGRSHRTSHDSELIRWGQPTARVAVEAERNDGTHRVEITLSQTENKKIRVNGGQIGRSGELMGHVNAVLFSPEDLRMVKGGPAERRRFIDMELSQIRPAYYYALQRYNRALRQRGKLLHDIVKTPSLLSSIEVWDEQIARHGADIIRSRRAFIQKLGALASETHLQIAGGGEELQLEYHTTGGSDDSEEALRSAIFDKLCASRESDIRRGVTSAGPHRDELVLRLNGRDARVYGSQGQQRACALSLKLSELRVMRSETGEWPVLMLDDVMSELDPSRRRQLLGMLDGVQVLVSCTDMTDLAGVECGRVFVVSGGVLN